MIDSLNPNSVRNLQNETMQEHLEERLWEIHSEFGGFNGFDLVAGIEAWLLYAYGCKIVAKTRYDRVVDAEKKLRKLKPLVTEMAETLRTSA